MTSAESPGLVRRSPRVGWIGPAFVAGLAILCAALAQQAPEESVKEKPTVTKFLAIPSNPVAAKTDAATTAREVQWQQQIRETAATWVQSGKMRSLMTEKRSTVPMTSGSVSMTELCRIADELLGSVGISSPTASPACRETAFAQAALGIESVWRLDEEFLEAVTNVKVSEEYRRLRKSLMVGFDGLSQPNVLLHDARLRQLARREVDKAYPHQPTKVREKLSEALANDLVTGANAAWNELSQYVRTIFFGNPEFGDREAFLAYDGFPARQTAMEKKILEMISKNPTYQKAILDPSSVLGLEDAHPDRNVKQLVSKHAARLAETIRDVPTTKP